MRASAGAQVRLRYRTEPGVGATFEIAGGTQQLPPSTQDGEFVLSLPPSRDGAPVTITLVPEEPGQLWIEQVELLSP
jgi:hypothetical protein